MGRTESISFQVHPNDEQQQISNMQKFHWNLLSTQEIKTVDSHMETRGDSLVSVTNSEHYTKLAFSRELDLPNLKEIKQLEQEYNSLRMVALPVLFPVSFLFWLVLACVFGLGVVLWAIYFGVSYKPKKAIAEETNANVIRRRAAILKELEKFD